MRIAIDIRNIGKKRTGDELVFFELVRHMAQCKSVHDFHLLIDTRPQDEISDIKKRLDIVNNTQFHIEMLGSGNKFIWNGLYAAQYCRKNKIDIYHTQYIIPFFMPAYTKIVTHVHDVSFRVHTHMITKMDAFFLNTLIPWSLKRSDKIIAVSQFTKNEIMTYYNVAAEKIAVVSNAASMQCLDQDHERIREKYHLPEKYILLLGTLQPRKNIPRAIEAFINISGKIPETFLVIAGKRAHNFDQKIDEMVQGDHVLRSRIIFTGYIDEDDKCTLYKMARVFIAPSLYEGFGMPVLEALHAGTDVVASDIAPHKEIGGSSVTYFDPQSVDQCAKVLYDALVNDSMEGRVDSSLENGSTFSWHRSAQNMLNVYDAL